MPEAAIDQDRNTSRAQGNVDTSALVIQQRTVDPKAETSGV